MEMRCIYSRLKFIYSILIIFLIIDKIHLTNAQNVNIKCSGLFRTYNQKNVCLCSACRLLINELEYKISLVDANKKIQVGNFRVDPNGNQRGLNLVYYMLSLTLL